METQPEPYPFWRWNLWCKGYGSYVDIEQRIDAGELDPNKPSSEYPDLRDSRPKEAKE